MYCGKCNEYLIFLKTAGLVCFNQYSCMPELSIPSLDEPVVTDILSSGPYFSKKESITFLSKGLV